MKYYAHSKTPDGMVNLLDSPFEVVDDKGKVVWEAPPEPKPKVRAHPAHADTTFWKEDGDYDLYVSIGFPTVLRFPAIYE